MPTQQEQVNAHTVDIQRFATSLLRAQIFPTLEAARKAAQLILLDYDEITGVTQLNAISRALRRDLTPILTEGWGETTEQMNEFAPGEAAFMAAVIASANDIPPLRIPTDEQIQRFINTSLMSLTSGSRERSGTWAEFVANEITKEIEAFNNQVKVGFSNGETVSQISSRLKTVQEGLLSVEAERLARTGVHHYAVQSRDAMARQNQDVITAKWYDIVFDNRTSSICMANNARNPYQIDDKTAPNIPAHYNCRSVWLYMVKGQDEPEGMRPVIGGQSGKQAKEDFEARQSRTDKKVRYRGRKDSDVFDVRQARANTKYTNFFLSQPVWWQNSTLGVAKARAVREGFDVANLTDSFNRPLTVSELAELHPKYFD